MIRNYRLRKFLIALIIIVFVVAGAYIYMQIPSNEYLKFYEDNEKVIYFEGERSQDHSPLYYDDGIYLSYDFVKNNISDSFFYNQSDRILSVIFDNKIIICDTSGTSIIGEGQEKEENYKIYVNNENVYIPTKLLENIFHVVVDEFENGIIVYMPNTEYEFANVNNDITKIRNKTSIKSPFTEVLNKNDKVMVINEEDNEFTYVLSSTGIKGYIMKEKLSEIYLEKKNNFKEQSFKRIDNIDTKLIAWKMIYNEISDTENIKFKKGLDVIVPTWSKLANENGGLVNWITDEYINKAKEEEIDVYLGVTNEFSDITMTKNFLSDNNSMDIFIEKLIKLTQNKELKGICIDFENIPYEMKDMFTQFIGKLSYYTHKNNIVLYVCTGVMYGSENYSLVYDHKKLAEYADYLMVMTYDEYTAGQMKIGPVASIGWMEKKIKEILEVVDNERIYLGVPLYTRIWQLEGEQIAASLTVSINRQNEILRENPDSVINYNNKFMQNEFNYIKDDKNYLMFIEDHDLIHRRIDIYNRYSLSGVFLWEESFTDEALVDFIANEMYK